MIGFKLDRSAVRVLLLTLAVLLMVQPLALPLHEYNLRQDGYKLVYDGSISEASPADRSETVAPRTVHYYNIAHCATHYLLQSLQQFQEILAHGLALAGLFLVLRAQADRSVDVLKNEFLSELILRAPPVPPARTV